MGIVRTPDEERMRRLAMGLSAFRMGAGALTLLAPRTASKVFGFPDAHDNATARMVGRLFAVREIALGTYTCLQVQTTVNLPDLYLANAAVDAGDGAVAMLTLLGRRGVDRGAIGIAPLAGGFTAAWLWLRGSCASA